MLDLVRLGEGRWLARAVVRVDGRAVTLEEVLESQGMPSVEAVLDLDVEPPLLVLRDREASSIVFASRQLDLTRDPNRSMSAAPAPSTAMT